ncbi:MAG: TonB-dependent receptor, partial [Bacteroidota bacterium]
AIAKDQIILNKVLKKLRSDYDLHFSYEGTFPKKRYVPELDPKDYSDLDSYFKAILENTDVLFFKITKKYYVLRLKNNKGFVLGKVVDSYGQPLIGATIQVLDDNIGTAADIDGTYFMEITPGKWKLRASYVGKQFIERSVKITPGDSAQIKFILKDVPYLKEVVVVGPRVSSNEILDMVSPTSVVNTQKEASKAYYGTSELLQYNIPSFHSTNQTISDGTDHLDPATLKGLGPDQLLVLVNGKRRHQSALVNVNGTVGRGSVSTDLNAIPTSAIERIEVLRDGASAHYGSDAIAGVVNIQLKKNTNHTSFHSKLGFTPEGDGTTRNFNANTSFDLNKNGGFLNLSLNYLKRDAINRSGAYTGSIFGD